MEVDGDSIGSGCAAYGDSGGSGVGATVMTPLMLGGQT